MTKQALVKFFFERNYMLSPGLLEQIPDNFNYQEFLHSHESMEKASSVVVIDEALFHSLVPQRKEVVKQDDGIVTSIDVVHTYVDKIKKREVKDFVLYLKARYKQLKKILLQRSELQGAVSISKAKAKSPKETVALIGIVQDISQTKNGHYILQLEDFTGIIKVLVSANRQELVELMDQVVLDEVVGVVGVMGEDIVFTNEFYFPDLPVKEYKKSRDDVSIAFISDLHIGSDLFAEKEFERFIEWINCNYGSEEQKEVARKVKYLCITGDLIDGVGIYPSHESELVIKDIYKQYEKLAEYLDSIRKDIKIVLCGGNHDALRLAEPQPELSRDFARSLYALKNVTIVSNPAIVRIHKQFDLLLYHGYGFDYYINNNQYLRDSGGYENSIAMMEFVLRKRHLGPTHVAGLTIPDIEKDHLVIDKVPDFFITGHIHYDFKVSSYKNVTMIGCSCFQYMSAFQEKLGHTDVTWGKTCVINLKSRKTSVVDFRD